MVAERQCIERRPDLAIENPEWDLARRGQRRECLLLVVLVVTRRVVEMVDVFFEPLVCVDLVESDAGRHHLDHGEAGMAYRLFDHFGHLLGLGGKSSCQKCATRRERYGQTVDGSVWVAFGMRSIFISEHARG